MMDSDTILTLVEKTALFKANSIFGDVPTEALAVLAARAKDKHFDAGEYVFREGEPNHRSLLVVQGQLEVRKHGQHLRVIDAGQGFGQLELREGDPHTVSVVALTHAHILWVTVDELFDSVADNPEIGVGLIRLLATRVQETVEHVLLLEQEIARLVGRLKAAGLALPGEEREPGGNGTPQG